MNLLQATNNSCSNDGFGVVEGIVRNWLHLPCGTLVNATSHTSVADFESLEFGAECLAKPTTLVDTVADKSSPKCKNESKLFTIFKVLTFQLPSQPLWGAGTEPELHCELQQLVLGMLLQSIEQMPIEKRIVLTMTSCKHCEILTDAAKARTTTEMRTARIWWCVT